MSEKQRIALLLWYASRVLEDDLYTAMQTVWFGIELYKGQCWKFNMPALTYVYNLCS
jgi:hypothetical protein